jgi:cytidylate kinase
MELSTDDVKAFDELAPSVVQDWILPLREEHYAPQEAYLDHLAKLI